jgi:hypothetical protein
VLVGTGEGNLSGDSYFGCGLYIITSASSTEATINGPYGLNSLGEDIFTGRSIVAIAVDPANHNNVFCATSTGVGGIVPSAYSVLPERGLYRSTNAFAAIDGSGTPRFRRLVVESTESNAITTSLAMQSNNANNLFCAVFSQNGNGTGGIYHTTNALASPPTFTRVLSLPDETNVKMAISQSGGESGESLTLYAATEEGAPNGRLYKSTDNGNSFTHLPAADGFAGTQGFYDIAIAVSPVSASRVFLGGNVGGNIFLRSNDGGTTFTSSVTGLHADAHAIAVAPGNTNVIYHGNDGGIWKSTSAGFDWLSLNNATFSATQFQDLAVHPNDRYFSIGGTQDNGTPLLRSDRSFFRADFGDGGYSLIDRNATNTTDVTMYHTYFNLTGLLLGTARVLNVPCAMEAQWSVHGAFDGAPDGPYCDGSFDTQNGISLTDNVNFYAPQALGPGNPNTWYFGSDKLYRSIDRANTANAVSQLLDGGEPVSAIAISPQNDNVRVVGLNNGKVFATSTGSPTLRQIAGPGAANGTTNTPATGVGRIAIDPHNPDIAFVCFNGFGTPGNPIAHVWKTTNLSAQTVTFTAASSGLPDVPVNAIAVDPQTGPSGNSSDIYVGTDIGVYYSANAGSNWARYGNGLPRVAVFGLEIQNNSRVVRAATHGRGLYETATVAEGSPTPAPSPNATPADVSTKLLNVATRGPVKTGEEVMIAGTIITAPSPKQVVFRALGPSLTRRGVVGAMADPTLSLFDANGDRIAYNDDFTANSGADLNVLFSNALTPSDTRESAIVATLPPAGYTVLLRGKTNGAALVEIYDISSTSFGKLANVSTRGKVEPGDNGALIGGFILSAPPNQPGSAHRVAIRAIGPTLGTIGISNVLLDPTLDLYRGSQLVLSNDDWRTNSTADQRELNSNGLGLKNDNEAALITTLEPGSYTAVVRGKHETTGVALVEIYDLSNF